MRTRHRRYPPDDRQLCLNFDAPLKECRSRFHEGDRLMTIDAFVRNGKHTRTVCRPCWAKEQRSNRGGYLNDKERTLTNLLNRPWIVRCDQATGRRR